MVDSTGFDCLSFLLDSSVEVLVILLDGVEVNLPLMQERQHHESIWLLILLVRHNVNLPMALEADNRHLLEKLVSMVGIDQTRVLVDESALFDHGLLIT